VAVCLDDAKQTLIAGYLPAEPPPTMLPRAAAQYRKLTRSERYRCFVEASHLAIADAVAIGKARGIVEEFHVEHQLAADPRAPPTICRRWTVTADGVAELAIGDAASAG
jgi:hypothetical protein